MPKVRKLPLLLKRTFPVIIFISISLYAQSSDNRDYKETPTIPYGGAQYYTYLGANRELQISVQVWGKISKPGLYSVPKITDIVGLISFAGGPSDGANLKKIKIVRSTPQSEIIHVDVKKYLDTGNSSIIPLLKPGDIVIIPEKPFRNVFPSFLQFLGVTSQVAGIITSYLLILDYLNKK